MILSEKYMERETSSEMRKEEELRSECDLQDEGCCKGTGKGVEQLPGKIKLETLLSIDP